MEGTDWRGKKVFARLKDDRVYQGHVIEENQSFFYIRDKYNKIVALSKDAILFMQEES